MNLISLIAKHSQRSSFHDLDVDLSDHLKSALDKCTAFGYPSVIHQFYSGFLIHAITDLLRDRYIGRSSSKAGRVLRHLAWLDSNDHIFRVQTELLRLYRESLVAILAYYKQGFLYESQHLLFFRLYIMTGGSSNHILSLLIDDVSEQEDIAGINDSIRNILYDLQTDGYSVVNRFISEDSCKDLISSVSTGRFFANPNLNRSVSLPKTGEVPLDTRYTYPNGDLITHSNYVSLFSNETIKILGRKYLRTHQPVLSVVGLNATYNYSSSACGESAQLYHWDLDSISWLKFFLYLSDVTYESGPHSYFPGTHHEFCKPWALLSKGYQRLDDNEISAYYRDQGILPVSITASAGTLIVADTRCYHKGTPCINGQMRWMLQLEYTGNRILRDIDSPCVGLVSRLNKRRYLINE